MREAGSLPWKRAAAYGSPTPLIVYHHKSRHNCGWSCRCLVQARKMVYRVARKGDLSRCAASTETQKERYQEVLRVIKQEIRSATEKQYLAQLEESTRTGAFDIPLTSPIFEPPPEDLPRPVQDSQSGEVLERMWQARPDLEGISAEGSGREVLLQAFNWESHRGGWWHKLAQQAQKFAEIGFTVVWLPPPTTSVAPQGYMPLDLYNLNSAYGNESDLRSCVKALQEAGLKVLCDAILNHRCASAQDDKGVWNKFGGKLDWDSRAIVVDDRNFGGRGAASSGEIFHAAPNIDHSQQFVKADIVEWMQWLREYIGYDGWRFDYVKGFSGAHVADYVAATSPDFVVGEYWDSLAYDGSVPRHNQDAHRQRTVNWLNSAQGGATAFDVTTKGILHAVFERTEYWRLKDAKGKPPGLIGWWPSRAVTFLENHDTGSTQGHWRFPARALEQGYAYIMTHPGTPSVFLDHLDDSKLADVIGSLIRIRKNADIHCRSKVAILEAEKDVYAAEIDDKLLLKIGPGSFDIDEDDWEEVGSGKRWRIWAKKSAT